MYYGGGYGDQNVNGRDKNGYSKIRFGSAVSLKTLVHVWWGYSFSRAQKPDFGVSM